MYQPDPKRYDRMLHRRCGRSGIQLPAISLGLWHNFGGVDAFEDGRAMARRAFALGITHFDLATNYGPPPGTAEDTLGRILAKDLRPYRDELVISTKAGWDMWPGPYGDWGSRKYLVASLDQSCPFPCVSRSPSMENCWGKWCASSRTRSLHGTAVGTPTAACRLASPAP